MFIEACGSSMHSDKRKEQRYPLGAEAIVVRKTGERVHAFTVNVSGSGVLLALESPALAVGDEVRCGIQLYENKPPQSGGVGKVVRVDESRVAIDFDVE